MINDNFEKNKKKDESEKRQENSSGSIKLKKMEIENQLKKNSIEVNTNCGTYSED